MKNPLYAELCSSYRQIGKQKGEIRRLGTGIINGRLGGKYAIVHFRGAHLEVDLYDMRSGNRLLDVLGRDVELRLHLTRTKSAMRYLVVSQAVISLSKMRNGIANRNRTTWTNTDARTSPNEFYGPTHNQKLLPMSWRGLENIMRKV